MRRTQSPKNKAKIMKGGVLTSTDAWEVTHIVLKQDAANGGTPVEYRLVLSAGSVCKSNNILLAPLELIAECVYAVLDVVRLLDKEPMSFEQRVEPAEDGIKARLENNYTFGMCKVDEVRDSAAGWDTRCNVLKERVRRKQMRNAGNKLASWQRQWCSLLNARKKSAASDGVRSVKDSTGRVDVDIVFVEIVVQVVWDKIAGGVVGALLAAVGLGAAVSMVSLLSECLLGTCWARC
jgi:hypothetical protein